MRRLTACAAATVLVAFLGSGVAVADDESVARGFSDNPSLETWAELERRVDRSGSGIVRDVVEYHRARERRDLPNSLVRPPGASASFVRGQRRKIAALLRSIKASENPTVWRLIDAMALQTFDDSLVDTASELVARVQPTRYDDLAKRVREVAPKNSWIMDRTRRDWLEQQPHKK